MEDSELAAFAGQLRTNYRATIPSAGTPDEVAEVREIRVSDSTRTIPVRAYRPAFAADAQPVVLFVHGGGFVSGDLDTHDVLVRALAVRVGALVLSVDYRLAPEHPYPAGVDDVLAVLDWAGRHAHTLGGDATRLALCGDSAGGNIATVATMITRDRQGPALKAQALLYPTLDNKMDTPSWDAFGVADSDFPNRTIQTHCLASYVPPEMSWTDPLVAPLWGDHRGLPPTLIQVGAHDPLRDECVAYAEALRSAGSEAACTVYPEAAHGFVQFFKDKTTHPRGEAALEDTVAFLRGHLAEQY